MTYSTLMVHLDGARPNAAVLDATATLAKQYDARVIGIAACEPVQLGASDGYMDGALAVLERDIVTEELAHAKVEFHAHEGLRSHVLEWRSIPTLENVAHTIAMQARCADLLITGVGPVPGDLSTHADTGDLILRAGRHAQQERLVCQQERAGVTRQPPGDAHQGRVHAGQCPQRWSGSFADRRFRPGRLHAARLFFGVDRGGCAGATSAADPRSRIWSDQCCVVLPGAFPSSSSEPIVGTITETIASKSRAESRS